VQFKKRLKCFREQDRRIRAVKLYKDPSDVSLEVVDQHAGGEYVPWLDLLSFVALDQAAQSKY
jgi:hypothetical protein